MTVLAWIATLVTPPGVTAVPAPTHPPGRVLGADAEVPPVRLWAFNVGLYNLFLGCGMIAGVITWAGGNDTCLFVFFAGIVFVSDRMALSRPRGTGVGGAIGQSLPPLVALIALALS